MNKCFCFLFVSTLIVLGSIRWQTGTDWVSYYNYFVSHKTWAQYNDGSFEVLYSLLNYLVRLFSDSYTCFLFVFSFLVIYIKYNIINRFALYPTLSFYLFFCTNIGDIFAIRQSLAISILFISIYFMHNKRKFGFFIIVLLATMIHTSSIIWVLSYYIYNKHFNTRFIVMIFIVSIGIGFFGIKLFEAMLNFIFMPFGALGRTMSKIVFYINDYEEEVYSVSKTIISVGKRFLFIPFFLLFRNRLIRISSHIEGILNLYFWGNIIYLLFLQLMVFQRLTTVFILMEIFILPVFLKFIKTIQYKYLYLCVFFIYGLLKLYIAILPFIDAYIPYYTIFNFKTRF